MGREIGRDWSLLRRSRLPHRLAYGGALHCSARPTARSRVSRMNTEQWGSRPEALDTGERWQARSPADSLAIVRASGSAGYPISYPKDEPKSSRPKWCNASSSVTTLAAQAALSSITSSSLSFSVSSSSLLRSVEERHALERRGSDDRRATRRSARSAGRRRGGSRRRRWGRCRRRRERRPISRLTRSSGFVLRSFGQCDAGKA